MSFTLVPTGDSLDKDELDLVRQSFPGQHVAIELPDGSMKVITKSGCTAHVTERSLELFGRKVEQRLEALSAEQGARADLLQYHEITSQSLIDIISSGDPFADDLIDGISNGDRDFTMGGMYDKTKQYHKAYECFQRSAAKGNIESKYNCALYHYHGDLGEIDYHKCYAYLEELKDSDHDGALYLLGQLYYDGKGGCPEDIKIALGYFQRSYDLGNNDSKLSLAIYYHYGYCMKVDHQRALELMDELAAIDYVSGEMYLLLWAYYSGVYNTEKDLEKAVRFLKKAAECEVIEAYFHLGVVYLEGVLLQQDYDMAFRLFLKNWEVYKTPQALMYMAHCYYFGLGVPIDKEKARDIVNLYPNKPGSHYHLGCFAKAEGDDTTAFTHFRNAVATGDKRASGPLGVYYFLGQGTAVHYKKAFQCLNEMTFETPEYLLYLSRCHAEGKGTPLNWNAAIVYSEISLKAWPDKETHFRIAELYLKSSLEGISLPVCDKIIFHYLAFLDLNTNPEDPRLHLAYYSLASHYQLKFKLFDQSIDILNQAVKFARKIVEDKFQTLVGFKNMPFEVKKYLKDVLATSAKYKEAEFNALSALDFAQVMRYDIFMQKTYFDSYLNDPAKEVDKKRFEQLKMIHAFLYEDLDREWGLLRKDQLRNLLKLITKLMGFLLIETQKIFNASDIESLQTTQEIPTDAEIAESFLPVMPKKKPKTASKPKATPKKVAAKKAVPKKVPAPKPVQSPVSAPAPVVEKPAEPVVVVPQVKSSSPPKPSVVKGRVSPPLTQTKEAKRVQKILNIAQCFKEAQAEVVAYYSEGVSSSLRRSIEAVFDKKSLSQEKVMALMEMIAKRENGQYVLNGNGGARIIVGDLSVGCHAFHGPGDKNHLGFIADLRKLMIVLYQKKK